MDRATVGILIFVSRGSYVVVQKNNGIYGHGPFYLCDPDVGDLSGGEDYPVSIGLGS